MATRKIVLETCSDCPHRDHKGAFGNPSCVPCCRHPNARQDDGMSPELPHTISEGKPMLSGGKKFHATPTYTIPEWCPLEHN